MEDQQVALNVLFPPPLALQREFTLDCVSLPLCPDWMFFLNLISD